MACVHAEASPNKVLRRTDLIHCQHARPTPPEVLNGTLTPPTPTAEHGRQCRRRLISEALDGSGVATARRSMAIREGHFSGTEKTDTVRRHPLFSQGRVTVRPYAEANSGHNAYSAASRSMACRRTAVAALTVGVSGTGFSERASRVMRRGSS